MPVTATGSGNYASTRLYVICFDTLQVIQQQVQIGRIDSENSV